MDKPYLKQYNYKLLIDKTTKWPIIEIWIDLTTNIAMCSFVSNSIVVKFLLLFFVRINRL